MPDVVDSATRSRIMSRIRGKNTKPEMYVRQSLHALGYRYRVHRKDLPGKPDLCFSGRKSVIFVHGCFWHGHDCHLFKVPETRKEFWENKIDANKDRDKHSIRQLNDEGWRVLQIWECALKGRFALPKEMLTDYIVGWLESKDRQIHEIRGMT